MGLFDFLRKPSGTSPAEQEKLLARHTERVMDKRSMSPDRFASIEYLCKLGTEEAWRALLPRYNFTVDPSITDREEKHYIFDQAVLPFLDDASEDTRFHAVRTLLAQDDLSSAPGLGAQLARDDSMRVRTTIVDGLVLNGWPVPEEHREKVGGLLGRLPNGPFVLGADGVIARPG